MILHPQGEKGPIWASNSGAPIRSPDGKIIGAVSIFTDTSLFCMNYRKSAKTLSELSLTILEPL